MKKRMTNFKYNIQPNEWMQPNEWRGNMLNRPKTIYKTPLEKAIQKIISPKLAEIYRNKISHPKLYT